MNTLEKAEWISQQEAAAKLSCSVDHVRRLVRRGELDARRFGRIIRIRATSLEHAGMPLIRGDER